MTAPGWRSSFSQGAYKQQMLARLRDHLPSLLIGIGDQERDVEAYSANDMLALRIGEIDGDLAEDAPNASIISLRNWAEIRRFFEEYRSILTVPDRLRERLTVEDFHEKGLSANP